MPFLDSDSFRHMETRESYHPSHDIISGEYEGTQFTVHTFLCEVVSKLGNAPRI